MNAIALEAVAAMAAAHAQPWRLERREVPDALLRRHFDRKHGPGAYYGQPGDEH